MMKLVVDIQPIGALAEDRSAWSEKRLESAAAELADRVRTLPRINRAQAAVQDEGKNDA